MTSRTDHFNEFEERFYSDKISEAKRKKQAKIQTIQNNIKNDESEEEEEEEEESQDIRYTNTKSKSRSKKGIGDYSKHFFNFWIVVHSININ